MGLAQLRRQQRHATAASILAEAAAADRIRLNEALAPYSQPGWLEDAYAAVDPVPDIVVVPDLVIAADPIPEPEPEPETVIDLRQSDPCESLQSPILNPSLRRGRALRS